MFFFLKKKKIAFTGDTLFSLGCGKIFEGDHEQLLRSLNKIKKLPRDTKIYWVMNIPTKMQNFVMKYDEDNISLKNSSKK
jgi:hydroxyacylglutathione hydrolase